MTQQDEAVGHLRVGETERPAVRISHFTFEEADAAGTAIAALAAVRQIQAGIERRVEHRPFRGHAETPIGLG
jgi:hypothetical protein